MLFDFRYAGCIGASFTSFALFHLLPSLIFGYFACSSCFAYFAYFDYFASLTKNRKETQRNRKDKLFAAITRNHKEAAVFSNRSFQPTKIARPFTQRVAPRRQCTLIAP